MNKKKITLTVGSEGISRKIKGTYKSVYDKCRTALSVYGSACLTADHEVVDSIHNNFKCGLGLERDLLSLVRTIG